MGVYTPCQRNATDVYSITSPRVTLDGYTSCSLRSATCQIQVRTRAQDQAGVAGFEIQPLRLTSTRRCAPSGIGADREMVRLSTG